MKSSKLLAIAIIPLFLTLSACGAWWLPRPHKIDIQQGNLLPDDLVSQVTVGMSRGQVVSLLGRPVATNQINPDRWEYIYSLNRSGEDPQVKRLSLDFQNDQVASLDSDGLSKETEENAATEE